MSNFEDYHFGQEMQHREYHPINLNFNEHIHRAFELWFCTKGTYQIKIEDNIHTLTPNDSLLILPFQTHSIKSLTETEGHIWIFSPEYILDFYHHINVNGKQFENPIIKLSPDITQQLMNNLFNNNSIYHHKWALYHLLSLYEQETNLIDATLKNSVTEKIANWFSKNYDKNKSLADLSNEIGYSSDYLSKLISNNFNANFNSIINQYRINHACYLLINSDYSITEISNLSGFQNMRTFNRNFMTIVKTTPRDYRSSNLKSNLNLKYSETPYANSTEIEYKEAFLHNNFIDDFSHK